MEVRSHSSSYFPLDGSLISIKKYLILMVTCELVYNFNKLLHNRKYQDVIGRNTIFIVPLRLEFIMSLVDTLRRLEGVDRFSAEGVNTYEGVPGKIRGNTFDRIEDSRST